MSYILDALNKSDQERQEKSGPNLQTIQRPHVINKPNGGLLWLVGILFFLLLAALGGWLYSGFFPWSGAQTDHPAAAPADPLPAVTSQVANESTGGAGNSATVVTDKSGAQYPVVAFSELPDPLQKEIPALTFSFHVYSENPSRRTIIINKQRVKQGDKVISGLLLEEVTAEGVVLNWKGRRFSINVVDNW